MPVDSTPSFWRRILQQSPNMMGGMAQNSNLSPGLRGGMQLGSVLANAFLKRGNPTANTTNNPTAPTGSALPMPVNPLPFNRISFGGGGGMPPPMETTMPVGSPQMMGPIDTAPTNYTDPAQATIPNMGQGMGMFGRQNRNRFTY